jgi:hypothetical protein
MHQSLQGATFHIEHITPESAGGPSELGNLALACPGCNLAKSSRVFATDPATTQPSRLFNPRADRWVEHFSWDENRRVVGLTPVGRTTIAALDMNHSRRVLIREAEEWFDLFPPEESA